MSVSKKVGRWAQIEKRITGKRFFSKKKNENRKEVAGSGMGSTLGGQEMIQSMK